MCIGIVVILSTAALFLFFRALDAGMEVDSLKSEIRLQKQEMHFLQSITNGSFSSCKTTVAAFESIVRENGRNTLWQGQVALVGPFRVKKKDSCIESIEAVEF